MVRASFFDTVAAQVQNGRKSAHEARRYMEATRREATHREGIAMDNTTTMTESTSLDTLAAAKDLQSAGFERKQAEALTGLLAQMATKGDIARLERAINERLETALKAFGELQQANIERLEERTAANKTLILHVMLPLHVLTLAAVMSLLLKAFWA